MAVKATAIVHDGVDIPIFKDPVTDDGTKKSLKGLLKVEKVEGKYVVADGVTKEEEAMGELKTVFKDGNLVVDDSLSVIRERVGSVG